MLRILTTNENKGHKITLGSLTHTGLCQALLLVETNKFLVERKLAGFSFSPSLPPPLFFFCHSPRFCTLLTYEMNGTGYMDIDARKQKFTVLKKMTLMLVTMNDC